ncbi:MAG: YaaC family protein [Pirellulaceae bacterium]|nr:YaaC family protein [Pirellulaceae bacterium]
MNPETWQQLLSLESREIVQQWFKRIHSRELNARRASEINAAAKQGREYFKNANSANYSVRPLLTFYGVSCLSRALLLLMKVHGGEEGLKPSHGLATVGWGEKMSGDIASGLAKLGDLKIRTLAGLFSEFATHTQNRISIHVHSSAVDWRLEYDVPDTGQELTFNDLLVRLPDVGAELKSLGTQTRHAFINEMSFTKETGFKAKVSGASFVPIRGAYEGFGYTATEDGEYVVLTCDAATFEKRTPLFTHAYIGKMFGSIPRLHIAEPFSGGVCFSQLCLTYMVSYVLGMLVRYFPTNWIALTQGSKGDAMWPTIHRAQGLVELTYPELVAEMIFDVLKQSDLRSTSRTCEKNA